MKTWLSKKLKRIPALQELTDTLARVEIQGKMQSAFARAAATAAVRVIDPANPESWEFSGFSQHGEDGIIDYLIGQMKVECRTDFFFEIGAADGIQNCTAWLAYAKNFAGVMVEGDSQLSGRGQNVLRELNWAVHFVNLLVDENNLAPLLKMSSCKAPDVFSLDIDGIDYYVARKVFELGFRPKIFLVEYNSAFGPDQALTIPYSPSFHRWQMHDSGLCYGASIAGWRRLFEHYQYEFITTEKCGINAFFIDPSAFPDGFANGLRKVNFRENAGDLNGATKPRVDLEGDMVLPARDWRVQFEMIKNTNLVKI
jgi:hypothetical protein